MRRASLALRRLTKKWFSSSAALDPVSIPHDNEGREVTTGTDLEPNPQVIGSFRRPLRVTEPARSSSQGGDWGSNPVGTTKVWPQIRVSRGPVAPHWLRACTGQSGLKRSWRCRRTSWGRLRSSPVASPAESSAQVLSFKVLRRFKEDFESVGLRSRQAGGLPALSSQVRVA